jgi:hypothetical protein
MSFTVCCRSASFYINRELLFNSDANPAKHSRYESKSRFNQELKHGKQIMRTLVQYRNGNSKGPFAPYLSKMHVTLALRITFCKSVVFSRHLYNFFQSLSHSFALHSLILLKEKFNAFCIQKNQVIDGVWGTR